MLERGDFVRVPSLRTEGFVVEVGKTKCKVNVAGNVTVTIDRDKVFIAAKPQTGTRA